MDVRIILAVSILLQFAAALLALRLIWSTGAGRAWGLISAAIFLMGVRRAITLGHLMFDESATCPNMQAELVALLISLLMLLGIADAGPFFRSVRNSEKALRESKRKLSALMANLPGMAYRCVNDRKWTMEIVSEGCFDLTGYRSEDLIGNKTIAYGDVVQPGHREAIWDQVQKALDRHEPFRLVYRIRTATGAEKWVWEQGIGVYSPQGEVVALEGFITDITERRQAEEVVAKAREELEDRVQQRTAELTTTNDRLKTEIAERTQAEEALAESELRFRSLVETTSDWIWEMDDEGVYTYASPKVEELLGYTPEEVLGRKPFDLMPPDEADEDGEEFREILARREPFVRLERTNLRKDGRQVTLETSGVPIFDAGGRLRGYRGVDRDITKPKQDEAQLIRTLAELERSNRDLAQFAYSASHDLQEPLRMMGSYLKALQDRLGEGLDDTSRSFVRLSLDASQRMQQLINDLLLYSRVGTRGREFQTFAADEAVDQAVANLEASIQQQGARITRDPLPSITADLTLIAQLFQNLISNAIKFHGEQPPEVHISCEPSGRDFLFKVRDNGIGIDPKYAERIFTVFERLHPQDEYPGTGIGLAICKRVVERHEGRIWCESQADAGATFCFTLPRERRSSTDQLL